MSVAKVHYYQGFHDLCSVLLLNCGEKIACACAERLAVFHQRDATLRTYRRYSTRSFSSLRSSKASTKIYTRASSAPPGRRATFWSRTSWRARLYWVRRARRRKRRWRAPACGGACSRWRGR